MRQVGKCLSISLLLSMFAALAYANSIASVQPASPTASVGDIVAVTVNVSNITDLFAFQFDINFNPAVLSAQSITEGAFLPSGGSTLFLPGSIDNIAGTIAFNADTLIGFVPGVSGGGTIATMDFLAIASGLSSLDLANTFFLDSNLANINNVTLESGTVNVTSATATPEPPTVVLMLGGIVALFWLAHRRLGSKSLLGRV
jgi:hypothetical protein